VLRGLMGEAKVVECAYVRSDAVKGVEYFSTPVTLGVSFENKTKQNPSFHQKIHFYRKTAWRKFTALGSYRRLNRNCLTRL
jgi:hypothetical protein